MAAKRNGPNTAHVGQLCCGIWISPLPMLPAMMTSVMAHLCRDLYAAGNCALTGMIVITSGCATYEPWASALGGVVGGLIILPSSLFVSHVLKIDDPVDAFAV